MEKYIFSTCFTNKLFNYHFHLIQVIIIIVIIIMMIIIIVIIKMMMIIIIVIIIMMIIITKIKSIIMKVIIG